MPVAVRSFNDFIQNLFPKILVRLPCSKLYAQVLVHVVHQCRIALPQLKRIPSDFWCTTGPPSDKAIY